MFARLPICLLFLVWIFIKSATCEVKSCYACAGPQSDCTFNNRTDFFKMDCSSFEVEGQSLIQRSSEPELLEKFDAQVDVSDQDIIGCLTLTFRNGNLEERAVKTCAPSSVFDQDICTFMDELVSDVGGQKTSCSFCKKDDCNSGVSVPVGTFALIMSLVYFVRDLL